MCMTHLFLEGKRKEIKAEYGKDCERVELGRTKTERQEIELFYWFRKENKIKIYLEII